MIDKEVDLVKRRSHQDRTNNRSRPLVNLLWLRVRGGGFGSFYSETLISVP